MDTQGIVGQIARIRALANLFIEQELQARGIAGIVPAHGAVLAFLFAQTQPVPIKGVVQHADRVKSTITGILNTLERHGYVRRFRSTDDQRVIYVALTEKGRALQEDFEAISEAMLDRVYGTMPQKDRKTLVQQLAVLEANLTGNEGTD